MKILILFLICSCFSKLYSQDSVYVKPSNIIKLAVASPVMYLVYPQYGMKYFGVGYEKYRNAKTSYNFYLDYFYIKDGSYNNTGIYSPAIEKNNYGSKNILSFRTLYKWYPIHKLRYFKGLYLAGGVNFALRIINLENHSNIESNYRFNLYSGLGWGLGYKVQVVPKLSVEMSYHRANNAIDMVRDSYLFNQYPIGIEIWEIALGYTISKKQVR